MEKGTVQYGRNEGVEEVKAETGFDEQG